MSVNICECVSLNGETSNNEQKTSEQEEMKLCLFDNCSKKSIEFLELNARNESVRVILKKSLNIYCEFINRHLETLNPTSKDLERNMNHGDPNKKEELASTSSSSLSSVANEDPIEEKWKKCLYSIIVAIVRVQRLDFENPDNRVDVELVIYFYELLLVC